MILIEYLWRKSDKLKDVGIKQNYFKHRKNRISYNYIILVYYVDPSLLYHHCNKEYTKNRFNIEYINIIFEKL